MTDEDLGAADPADDARRTPHAAGANPIFDRVSALGAAAQASVPGLYAWALTVAPAAFGRGASFYAKVAAMAGLVALGLGVSMERRWGARARHVAVWGLSLTSGLVWALVPTALSPARLDVVRGVAGMLGWALFAFACAAPALKRDPNPGARLVDEAPMRPRMQLRRGDGAYVAGGVILAVALQGVGWQVATPERALLIRLVAVASGIAVLGTATSISLARHGRAAAAPMRRRFRRALPWIVALVMCTAGGLMWMRA